MSWTDKELDELFRNAASDQYFRYNNDYFKDIEAQLPVRKRRGGIIWWSSGVASMLAFFTLIIIPEGAEMQKAQEANLKSNRVVRTEKVEASATASGNTSGQGEVTVDPANAPAAAEANLIGLKTAPLLTNEPVIVNDQTANLTEIQGPAEDQDKIGTLEIQAPEATEKWELVERSFKLNSIRRNVLSLYAELNAGIGQSPIKSAEAGSSMSSGYGLSVGVQFERGAWVLSGGAGVSRRHFDNVFIKERSVIYGFGVNNYDNQYHFSSLVTLDLPLRAGYRFGRHLVEAGLTTSLSLISTVNYQESIDGMLHREGSGIATADLFNSINLRPELRYSFALNDTWNLGASVAVQTGSGIASERFKGEENRLPLSGSVSLKRTFDLR